MDTAGAISSTSDCKVSTFPSQLTAGDYFDYRESMHVIIASLDLAPKGKGDWKLLCHRDAASNSLGTSAIALICGTVYQ